MPVFKLSVTVEETLTRLAKAEVLVSAETEERAKEGLQERYDEGELDLEIEYVPGSEDPEATDILSMECRLATDEERKSGKILNG